MWHHGILCPNTMLFVPVTWNSNFMCYTLTQSSRSNLSNSCTVKSFLSLPDEVKKLVIPCFVTTLNPIYFFYLSTDHTQLNYLITCLFAFLNYDFPCTIRKYMINDLKFNKIWWISEDKMEKKVMKTGNSIYSIKHLFN